jgi:hypothetical protein
MTFLKGSLEQRNRVILLDGEIFNLYEYQREEELGGRVSKLVEFVFGPKVLYFDIRQRLASQAKKANVTDAILLELKKDGKSRLRLVEYELSSHDLYSHVQPQIMGFLRSLRNPQALRDVQLSLYEEIQADEGKRETFMEFMEPTSDMFFFLDRILHERCGVVIIIDEATPQLMEICEDLSSYAEVRVIEFKTYRKGDREIYHFNPFWVEEVAGPPEREERAEHQREWEARLAWVGEETRSLVREFIGKVERELPGVNHRPKQRWYCFYRGKSLFAVLLLSKRKFDVRIRVEPSKFRDRLNMTKAYRGWFFRKGREKGFSIGSPDQLDYALELVKQAHEYAEL